MPSILSKEMSAKLLGREWSFGYNCYEVGHTWTPSCTDAALEVSTAAALKIMPLYAMLYTFNQLAVQRRYDIEASWDTTKSILRSSFFIFFHAYNGTAMGCALRRSFGRFYYRILVCAPALLSSYLSLVIEKPARRQALAFYMLNLASEIVYRMAVTKGYFKPIKHGDTLLFALSLASWYQLLKEHGFGHDPVSAAVKVLIGRDEAKSRARTRRLQLDQRRNDGNTNEKTNSLDYDGGRSQYTRESKTIIVRSYTADDAMAPNDAHGEKEMILLPTGVKRRHQSSQNIFNSLLEKWCQLIDITGQKWFDGKHECCPHQDASCLRYVIGPIPTRFLLGYMIQSTLRLAARPIQLIQAPSRTIRDTLTSFNSIRFGLFIMTLVSSGRLTSCLLRRYSNSNEPVWHGTVSGFVAGLSMLWAPRSSLSMYVMWKAVEQYYLLAASQGKVKHFNFTILTIYSISAATILYTFALEPRFVRPSYMKFLDNLSNHRLHQLNRMVLDVFGTGSSIGYEDYFPDLDPKFMSNQFKELVFNWMIQPYE